MAERLENNITAHQRLLGDVSHELRSPLTRLQLAIALAEKNIGNEVEQQKHLNRCETEADRLDEMIADVLTLSRLDAAVGGNGEVGGGGPDRSGHGSGKSTQRGPGGQTGRQNKEPGNDVHTDPRDANV